MGIMDSIKNIFGAKKDNYENDVPRRFGAAKNEEVGEAEFTPRYKLAKQWRDEKQMQEPLVKREGFKRKIQ